MSENLSKDRENSSKDVDNIEETLAFKRFKSLATTPSYTGVNVSKHDVNNNSSLLSLVVSPFTFIKSLKISRENLSDQNLYILL